MIPVLDSRQMRAADAAAIRRGIPSLVLMENAARGIVESVARRFPGWSRVVVACGPGNNGGDGLAAARLLAGSGLAVRIFTLADPDTYRGDPATNAARARQAGLALEPLADRRGMSRFAREVAQADGVVDALFGTGLRRPLDGAAARAVRAINSAGRPVISADVPSGLSSDTGEVAGDSVRAALTVAFGAPKLCHALTPARRRCGEVVVHDIGIPPALLRPRKAVLFLATEDGVRRALPVREPDIHKGAAGRVAVLAGSRGKTGAAVLVARGALRAGAGLVTVFCPASVELSIVSALPEAMTHGLAEEQGAIASGGAAELERRMDDFDTIVVGPGLGTARGTVEAIERIVRTVRIAAVIDADGLNAFAGRTALLRRRRAPTVLTPHPGEAARLLGIRTREVQADRLSAARELARLSRCVVLLKGEGSLTATPDRGVIVNPTGSPLLATAGSGDVLAGAIGALLAAGVSPREASAAGAWLHGRAAERLAETLGDAGLLAHEVADALPQVRRELAAGEAGGD